MESEKKKKKNSPRQICNGLHICDSWPFLEIRKTFLKTSVFFNRLSGLIRTGITSCKGACPNQSVHEIWQKTKMKIKVIRGEGAVLRLHQWSPKLCLSHCTFLPHPYTTTYRCQHTEVITAKNNEMQVTRKSNLDKVPVIYDHKDPTDMSV